MPKLIKIAPKSRRRSYQQRSGCGSKAASILFKAASETPRFEETKAGDLVRIWNRDDWRHVTNEDVAGALRGQLAFDHEELLAVIPPQSIKDALTRGWLAPGAVKGLYFVTRKAAAELDLPRKTRDGRQIRFLDRGL